jgi:hypothetical protein
LTIFASSKTEPQTTQQKFSRSGLKKICHISSRMMITQLTGSESTRFFHLGLHAGTTDDLQILNLIKQNNKQKSETKYQISGKISQNLINQWVIRKHQPMTKFFVVSFNIFRY